MTDHTTQPILPFLLFHPKFIVRRDGRAWQNRNFEGIYALGWFRDPCFAIDVDCRLMPLTDVINHGKAWTISNLFPGKKGYGRELEIEYVFGEPTQLSFDEARETFVEYVCARRWWNATHETQAQFRKRNEKYTNMRELMEFVGMAGKWPAPRKPSK